MSRWPQLTTELIVVRLKDVEARGVAAEPDYNALAEVGPGEGRAAAGAETGAVSAELVNEDFPGLAGCAAQQGRGGEEEEGFNAEHD